MAEEQPKSEPTLVERWLEEQQQWQKTLLTYVDSLAKNEEFLVHLGNAGRGVHRQLVHLGDAGQGVQHERTRLLTRLPDGGWELLQVLIGRHGGARSFGHGSLAAFSKQW